MREYYPDLQGFKSSDPVLIKPVKLRKRCYDQIMKDENEITVPSAKSKYCQPSDLSRSSVQYYRRRKLPLDLLFKSLV